MAKKGDTTKERQEYDINYTPELPLDSCLIELPVKGVKRVATLGPDELVKLSAQGLDIIIKMVTTDEGKKVVFNTVDVAKIIDVCAGLTFQDLLDNGYEIGDMIQASDLILRSSRFFGNPNKKIPTA